MSLSLVPISLREASEFVSNFHRHNKAPQGGKFAIGVSNGDGLVGVSIIGRPVARMFDDFTAEVLRVCTTDESPKNVCSMLYGASWRAWKAMGGNKLITYTLQTETGASVKAAGFKVVAETSKRKEGSAWTSSNRSREWQPIYGQLKFRWEKAA
tara:strand:+ start:937 stop:1398 length:462 start_codon:yes stop_codon:yes gene_type:complete